MQQRGQITMEASEDISSTTPPSSRSRHNSNKLKVLVRSHAMREETSPPREPYHHVHYPPPHPHNGGGNNPHQPRINLIPSPPPPPSLSPTCTITGGASPILMLSPTLSPTTTADCLLRPVLVLSPQCLSPITARSSPTVGGVEEGGGGGGGGSEGGGSEGEERLRQQVEEVAISSPKYHEKSNNNVHHNNNGDMTKQQANRNNKKYHHLCDCQNQNCIKCVKERSNNNNNNNFSNVNNNVTSSSNMLTVTRANGRGKLRQQSSSQGSFESSSNSPCLSRDSSSEQYTDGTGVDLELFIPETLNRNAKDRALMLRIEQELVNLAKDKNKSHYKFPPMSSYQRMLVHRCAAYFGMDHNIEPTGKCVIVNKTKNTRIPDVEFKEHIKEDIIFSEEPRRSILKRDSNSIEDYRSFSAENRRSKSFEEREEEYEKARRRIFNREVHHGSSEDFGWSEMPWSSTESDYSSRFRLQPPQEFHRRTYGKLIKVHSEDTGDTQRPCVAKSYSFGGYGGNVSVLSRGDSVLSTHSAGPRLLTKQDSGASSVSWRLSPSSSGYKSQSQMSESVTPSPTSTPHPGAEPEHEHIEQSNNRRGPQGGGGGENHIVWAVTDIQDVPKGSVIIDPQTGRALKNDDGTVYLYDPNNPPPNPAAAAAAEAAGGASSRRPQSAAEERIDELEESEEPQQQQLQHVEDVSRLEVNRKLNFTNSSTSPSLPYAQPVVPPGSSMRRYATYVQPVETVYAPAYNPTYGAPNENGMYQPYVVYGVPYGMQYDNRMEPQAIPEMDPGYYVAEGATQPPNHLGYPQTAQYWSNQHVAYYPNGVPPTTPTPPHRYPTSSLPAQADACPIGYMTTGYPANYLATAPAAPQPQPQPQPPQNHDLVPVYTPNHHPPHPQPQPQQQHLVYQNQAAATNNNVAAAAAAAAFVYSTNHPPPQVPHPPVIYAHNPVYQPQLGYQPQQPQPQQNAVQYPQSTPTPNSCASSTSGSHPFSNNLPEHQTFMQLAQNVQQLSLAGQPQTIPTSKGYEYRPRSTNNCFRNSNQKFCKNISNFNSGQSSAGTNSPAGTVIAASYCPQNAAAAAATFYRTPPETPPAAQFVYPPNFGCPPALLFKQVGSVRAGTPGRSSRSPTPAGEMSIYDRQRMPLAQNIYQGMPYVVSDTRFIPGRNQQGAFKHHHPTHIHNNKGNYIQGSHNKNRKTK